MKGADGLTITTRPFMELNCIRRAILTLLQLREMPLDGILSDLWDFNLAIEESSNKLEVFQETGRYVLLHDLRELYAFPSLEKDRSELESIKDGLIHNKNYLVSVNPHKWYKQVYQHSPPYHTILLIDYRKDTGEIIYWDGQLQTLTNIDTCSFEDIVRCISPEIMWEIGPSEGETELRIMQQRQLQRVIFRMNMKKYRQSGTYRIYHGLFGMEQFIEAIQQGDLHHQNRNERSLAIYQITRLVQQRTVFMEYCQNRLEAVTDSFNKKYLSKWNFLKVLFASGKKERLVYHLNEIIDLENELLASLKPLSN